MEEVAEEGQVGRKGKKDKKGKKADGPASMDMVTKTDETRADRAAGENERGAQADELARYRGAITEAEGPPPGQDLSTDTAMVGADQGVQMARMENIDDAAQYAMAYFDRKGVEGEGLTEGERRTRTEQLTLSVMRAELLRLNRQANVQTLQAPGPEDVIRDASRAIVRSRVDQGLMGTIGIFGPDDVSDSIIEYQGRQEITQMTEERRRRLLLEMKPWWNEFRLVRTNIAVQEAEAMPTRLITSPTSDMQLASKPRGDMTENEENFFYFMFWLMRSKLLRPEESGLEPTMPWSDFFQYAAAMGYNDMTRAQINWLLTGSPDGRMETGEDFSGMSFNEDSIMESARIEGLTFKSGAMQSVALRSLAHTQEPKTMPPNKSVSPSGAPGSTPKRYRIVDGKMREVTAESMTFADAGRNTVAGIPDAVSNIPDPRYSERGGKMVPNVRIVTRRNPDFDPEKPTGADNQEFLHDSGDPGTEVTDVGAGSKDVNAELQKAQADRLLAGLPFRMYAPIHPQACDRYLGQKNYARLALEPERYFRDYSQHPFGPDDKQQQLNWNQFIITVYGPMLYAFVTDLQMQRNTPVFGLATPDAVTLEYMELNELVNELKAYQMKSTDRANRVGDSGTAQTPIDKHLDDFFTNRDQSEQQRLDDANAVIVALPDNPPPPGGDTGVAPPQDPTDPAPPTAPTNPADPTGPQDGPSSSAAPSFFSSVGVAGGSPDGPPPRDLTLGPREIDHGIRRDTFNETSLTYNHEAGAHAAVNDPNHSHRHLDRRSKMYHLLHRR
jgi:hypothetical protein